jgi:hypothetical protein
LPNRPELGPPALVCAMVGVALWTFSAWLPDER